MLGYIVSKCVAFVKKKKKRKRHALRKPSFLCARLLVVCLLVQPDGPCMSWWTLGGTPRSPACCPSTRDCGELAAQARCPSKDCPSGPAHDQLRNKDQDIPDPLRTLGDYSGSRAPLCGWWRLFLGLHHGSTFPSAPCASIPLFSQD